MIEERTVLSRRRILFAAAALPVAALLPACSTTPGPRRSSEDGPEPTAEQTEGPFYRLFSTPKSSLREAGMTGTELEVTGRVVTRRGKPLADTLLDFWHCDAGGVYDTRGYRLRGHQFTDEQGRFRLTTIVPGLYTGRTRHIHVKVQPAGADLAQAPRQLNLTTQLYFPDEPGNRKDDLFDASLVMAIDAAGEKQLARFDFVLDLG